MAAKDFIGYKALVEKAHRLILREVLTYVTKGGIMGSHHFMITLDPRVPGVEISDALRERYPAELTIVLQHQFWNLKVTDDYFEVGLSFNKVPEQIRIPFAAVRQFVDPSQNFGFRLEGHGGEAGSTVPEAQAKKLTTPKPEAEAPPKDTTPQDPTIVSLDKFRKK